MDDDLFTLDTVRDFMLDKGGKVTNHQLVTHFKTFLNDPIRKQANRGKFKDFVNTLASVKLDTSGEKVLVLKRKYRDIPTESTPNAGVRQHKKRAAPKAKIRDAPAFLTESNTSHDTSGGDDGLTDRGDDSCSGGFGEDGAIAIRTGIKADGDNSNHTTSPPVLKLRGAVTQESDTDNTSLTSGISISTDSSANKLDDFTQDEQSGDDQELSSHPVAPPRRGSRAGSASSGTHDSSSEAHTDSRTNVGHDTEKKSRRWGSADKNKARESRSGSLASEKSSTASRSRSGSLAKERDDGSRSGSVNKDGSSATNGHITSSSSSRQSTPQIEISEPPQDDVDKENEEPGELRPAKLVSVKDRVHKLNSTADLLSVSTVDNAQRGETGGQNKDEDTQSTSSVAFHLGSLEREWLLVMCKADYQDVAKLLLKNPHLIKVKDVTMGYTAIHWACKHGKVDLAKMLCGTPGAQVNARSYGGYTALHLAAMHGHEDIIELLVTTYHADTNMRDYSGKKPKQYLRNSARTRTQQLLLSRTDPNANGPFRRQGSYSNRIQKSGFFGIRTSAAFVRSSWANHGGSDSNLSRHASSRSTTPSPQRDRERERSGGTGGHRAARKGSLPVTSSSHHQLASPDAAAAEDSELMPPPDIIPVTSSRSASRRSAASGGGGSRGGAAHKDVLYSDGEEDIALGSSRRADSDTETPITPRYGDGGGAPASYQYQSLV